jgi:hypothetical protein
MTISAKERLYWFCDLVMRGYTSREAEEILDKAIADYEDDQEERE